MLIITHNLDELADDLRAAADEIDREQPKVINLVGGHLYKLVAADFAKKASGGTGAGGIRWAADKSGDGRRGRESGRLEDSLKVRLFQGGFELFFDVSYAGYFDAKRTLIPDPLPKEWIDALEADLVRWGEAKVQQAING